jgi:hypothetical protein
MGTVVPEPEACPLPPIERPPIEPLRPAFSPAHHSAAQLDRLKQATLDILEKVGVKVQSEKALDLLAEHGVRVDRAAQIAKFPPEIVLAAMAQAPRRFTLGARDASCEIPVGDGNTYCTTDGSGVEIVDFETRVRRQSTKADVADVTRIQDYLSSIAFWWPTLSAGDYGETSQLHELDAGWNNTVKHLQGFVQGEREARYAVEMATVIAGSAEELRRRPVLSDLIGVSSPLVVDKDAIEAALVLAEAGVPVCWVTEGRRLRARVRRAGRRDSRASARQSGRAGAALRDAELGRSALRRIGELPAGLTRALSEHRTRAPLGCSGRVRRLRHRLAVARHLAGRRRGGAGLRASRPGGL